MVTLLGIVLAWDGLWAGPVVVTEATDAGLGFSPDQTARKEAFLDRHFPGRTSERPLVVPEGGLAFAVLGDTGQVLGWWFCTDRMPPVVRGFGGEIGALVALSSDGLILGIEVIRHHETPSYYQKLDAAFLDRFRSRRADAGDRGLDAVTGATRSSRALIRDVTEGAATLWKAIRSSGTSEPPLSGP